MSHHSSSVNGKGTSHKDPLSRILDELSSLKLWKEKQEKKEKGKKNSARNKSRWKKENKRGRKKKNNERKWKEKNMPPIVVITLARA